LKNAAKIASLYYVINIFQTQLKICYRSVTSSYSVIDHIFKLRLFGHESIWNQGRTVKPPKEVEWGGLHGFHVESLEFTWSPPGIREVEGQ
jgi:hypothetical protein